MLRDLVALTPPVVVCAAFLVGLVLLLRHEMAPKRGEDEPADAEDDISGNDDIVDVKRSAPVTRSGDRDGLGSSRGARRSAG